MSLPAVHGFDSTMYVVEEGQRLDTTLVLNVKGTTVVYQQIGFNFAGTILSEAAGSASEPKSSSRKHIVSLSHTLFTL